MIRFWNPAKVLGLGLFMGIFALSCASGPDNFIRLTAEYLEKNPNPRPDFVSVPITSGLGDECIEINQHAIWEPGDTADNLQDHLSKNIQLMIDDRILLSAEQSVKAIHLSGHHIYNDNNQIMGSTGGPISVCAETEGLSNGIHLAKVMFSSTSGKAYSYLWSFELQ